MDRDQKLWDEIVMPIYKEMYEKATPSADIDKMIESGETRQEGFYNNYYLSDKEQTQIIEKHLKGKRLSKLEKQKVRTTVILGSSPSIVKKEKK